MNQQPKPPPEPRPPAPIESFGSELFNALIQGSKQRVTLPDIPYRDAVTFRHRCHMLRNRMRKDAHPLAKVAARAKFSIEWDKSKIDTLYNKKKVAYPRDPDAPVTLIIEPFDSKFRDVLKAAGIDVHRRVDSGGAEPPQSGDNTPAPSLDKLLGDL